MILAIRLPLLLKSPRLLVKTVAINQRGNNMVNWQDIDTVLLDMDGTLLDLHFDNYFWLHYLPEKYASAQNISLELPMGNAR